MQQPGAILYAEDEAPDVFFLQRAFTVSGLPHRLIIAPDGQYAINYLTGLGSFADRERYPLPALVLLDIHLPKASGLEVLGWIRQQPQFKTLPVVMLTSSVSTADREKARELGANDYLIKPSDPLELAGMVKSIHERSLSKSGRE